MNPANHQRHAIEVDGIRREFFSLPWPGTDAAGQPRRYFIWGATAAMLRNLYRFLVRLSRPGRYAVRAAKPRRYDRPR